MDDREKEFLAMEQDESDSEKNLDNKPIRRDNYLRVLYDRVFNYSIRTLTSIVI